MSSLSQKDIVLVPFPFSDQLGAKKRPVLVVSNNNMNFDRAHCDFIGVAITSKIRGGNYRLKIDNADTVSGFLPKKSEINCDKIASIPKNFIVKKICSLNNRSFTKVESILKQVFNIN